MKPITMTLCASVLMALAVPVQAAGDPKAGQVKTSMCAGCHGIPGWRTAYIDKAFPEDIDTQPKNIHAFGSLVRIFAD